MTKTAGRGTTVSIDGNVIGTGLVQTVGAFGKSMSTDDVTAIDSVAEERAPALDSWGASNVSAFWNKMDAALIAAQAARDDAAAVPVVLTFGDGSTQTVNCLVTKCERQQATRTNHLMLTIELMPVGAVTEAAGA